MFLPIYECSSTCSGDIFPIIHGGYFTGDDGTIQSYNFCNIMYAEIVDFSLFSNGDFFYLYRINVNNMQFNNSFNLDSTGLLMRVDATTGRTIWAKDIIFEINYAILRVYVCPLKDNLLWCLVTIYGNSNYFGIITQVDFDGNMMMSFSIVNRVDAPKSNIKFFVPEFLNVDDDHSIILCSETTFYQNEMGVSSNSQVDISILKFDRNQNIEWSTSIDYGNLIDHASSSNIFNRNIYVSFNSNDIYLCICKISLDDGSYQHSSIVQSIQKVPFPNGRFNIIMIDSSYIFAYDNFITPQSCNQFLIYDTTMKLVKKNYLKLECLYGVQGIVFENTQYSYAFIIQINQQFKIMRLDNDFNANFSMLSFSQININNTLNNFKLKRSNNTIYLCSTMNTKFDINTSRFQSYTIPLNMSLNSENCVYSNLNEYNESYYYEIPIGSGADAGFDYNVVNIPLNIATLSTPSNLESVDVLSNTVIIDLTECIWPRFDCKFGDCSFPLPEFILDDSYLLKIGMLTLFKITI